MGIFLGGTLCQGVSDSILQHLRAILHWKDHLVEKTLNIQRVNSCVLRYTHAAPISFLSRGVRQRVVNSNFCRNGEKLKDIC